MVPSPSPRRAPPLSDPDAAAQLRRLHCANYGRCLDRAVKLGWPSFACDACDVRAPLAPLDEKRDLLQLLLLRAVVEHPEKAAELHPDQRGRK